MTVKIMVDGETVEVNEAYALRMVEHGKAEYAPEAAKAEPETGEEPETEAPKAEPAKAGKKGK